MPGPDSSSEVGGEELRRALAALSGANTLKDFKQNRGAEASISRPVPLPIQLTETTEPSLRELAYAAQRYIAVSQSAPKDFDSIYNSGLALQEIALRASLSRQQQLQLLTQAAGKYEAAWKLKASSHAALYNWGVALSDLARVVKPADKDEAHVYLKKAAEKYALSLKIHPNNPQALNNWGLVLQELSAMKVPAEHAALVQQSISKFRRAIRLRPDFDRACYNLGTVFYAFACTQQSYLTQRLPSRVTQDPEHVQAERKSEATTQQTFALAAQYILLAHALQPAKDTYRKSLPVVQPLLPLPHLRAGFLTAPEPSTAHTSQESTSSSRRDSSSSTSAVLEQHSNSSRYYRIGLEDVVAAKPCVDLSLPRGHAFWLGLQSNPCGMYLIAGSRDEAEGWIDAIQLCAHIATRKRLSSLQQALKRPVNS